MNDSLSAHGSTTSAPAPAWLNAMGALLRPWIRIRRAPDDVRALLPDDPRPTVYVVERYGLSDTLILEQACIEAGLPSPYAAADRLPIKRRRAVIALSRRPRLFGRRPHPTRSQTLSLLADIVRADPAKDVRLVPVSIFVGRAPARESGWFSVLFSENWVVVGRFPPPAGAAVEWSRHGRAVRSAGVAARSHRRSGRTRTGTRRAQTAARAACAFPSHRLRAAIATTREQGKHQRG